MTASTKRNIFRPHEFEPFIQRLCVEKISGYERTIFPTIKSLLCFCAMLALAEEDYQAFERSSEDEDIAYSTFESDNAEDYIYIVAYAHSQDTDILRAGNEDNCISLFEGYASVGLAMLNDHVLKFGVEYPEKAILDLLFQKGHINTQYEEPDFGKLSF